MYQNLCEREKKWISSLLNVNFKGRDILIKQVANSKVVCSQEYDYISIKFFVEAGIELYPYKIRVPVEMRAFQEAAAPIVFLLHIINGVIDEMEIITADSSQINPDNITLTNVEYEVNKEVLLTCMTMTET